MAVFVDYAFYTDSYHGTALSSTEFPAFAVKACAEVNLVTFDRADEVIATGTDTILMEKIRMAACAAAEQFKIFESVAHASGVIASETVGSHSISYATSGGAGNSVGARINASIYRWLANTGLMFGGVE